jgi:hypothetical protein
MMFKMCGSFVDTFPGSLPVYYNSGHLHRKEFEYLTTVASFVIYLATKEKKKRTEGCIVGNVGKACFTRWAFKLRIRHSLPIITGRFPEGQHITVTQQGA